MPLLPVLRPLLVLQNALERPSRGRTVAQRRAASSRSLLQMRTATARGPWPVRTVDHQVPVPDGEILVRSYRPAGSPEARLPVLVYLHGGAFWLGSVAEYDPLCRWYAGAVGCVVVSVDYRLAPEHRFPTAPEDSYAALLWVVAHAAELGVDPGRLGVAGFSAGGNLAAVLTLMARDRGGPAIAFQVLESPVVDLTMSQPSTVQFANGFGLTRDKMVEGYDFYLGDAAQAQEAYVSPLLADNLSGLPPAYIRTAEFDPLRDEGEAYALRLTESGVRAEVRRVPGHVHASVYLSRALPSARRALDHTAAAMRRGFAAAATGGIEDGLAG